MSKFFPSTICLSFVFLHVLGIFNPLRSSHELFCTRKDRALKQLCAQILMINSSENTDKVFLISKSAVL